MEKHKFFIDEVLRKIFGHNKEIGDLYESSNTFRIIKYIRLRWA